LNGCALLLLLLLLLVVTLVLMLILVLVLLCLLALLLLLLVLLVSLFCAADSLFCSAKLADLVGMVLVIGVAEAEGVLILKPRSLVEIGVMLGVTEVAIDVVIGIVDRCPMVP
jgi:hypothetical protein